MPPTGLVEGGGDDDALRAQSRRRLLDTDCCPVMRGFMFLFWWGAAELWKVRRLGVALAWVTASDVVRFMGAKITGKIYVENGHGHQNRDNLKD